MSNNRIIKFRAWDKKEKEMCLIESIDFSAEFAGIKTGSGGGFTEDLDNLILMQYTGLKDKRGVKIYEGDIVEIDEAECGGKIKIIVEVLWKNCGFKLRDELGGEGYPITDSLKCSYVVGNIYENPKLCQK